MSPSGSGYALKFISGKYQGGEFPLRENKVVIIGRSSELDMVLVEDMVSRKHAKLTIDGTRMTIEDLGSTNGTFVNGEKVKSARVKEGDRILIGTSILKVVRTQGITASVDEAKVKESLAQIGETHATKHSKTAMTGKLEEVPLPDLLQLFHTSKKNGVLVVRHSRDEAKLYLRQGRVYYAVINDNQALGPQKSFNRIITWETGDFELQPPDGAEFMVELDTSTEALLMDSLRQLDEYKRIAHLLPSEAAHLSLARPLAQPLRALNSDELDTLQLVLNHGTLRGVMDHSDKDDVVASQNVLSLIQREYLVVGDESH